MSLRKEQPFKVMSDEVQTKKRTLFLFVAKNRYFYFWVGFIFRFI